MESLSSFVEHYEFLDVFLVSVSMIFFLNIRLESRATCQKEVKRRLRTKGLRWRKRDHAWWRAIRGVRKSLHEVLESLVNPGNTDERKEVEIVSWKLVRPDSRRQAQRCRHQPVCLTAVLFHFVSTEVAESEFRTQPVATALNATVCVWTPHLLVRAQTHIVSCAGCLAKPTPHTHGNRMRLKQAQN